ncbi:MAG: putative transport system permease protein [Verrucomicrobiota bacterium]|jgi:putative ABC transport system permease protein|nr:putative transport system permease protein [Verrucomicrobiota bacterium]
MRNAAEWVEGFRIAIQQIAANRTRSILTALGVAIGIIAVTLMGTAIRGIDIGFNRSMSGFGDDVLYIEQWPWSTTEDFWQFRNRPDIKLSTADRLNQMIEANPKSLLELAVPAPASAQTVVYGERRITNVYTMGTTNEYAYLSTTSCEKGRFINEAESRGGKNVCVVGQDVANGLFNGQDPIDKVIRVRDHEYRIIGLFARQGSFLGVFSWDSQVVIPLASYIRYFKSNQENASIRVKVRNKTQMAEATEELRGEFRRIRALWPEDRDNFAINEQKALRSSIEPVKVGLAIAGLFITGLALFVGAIGIMNITFVSVKERTREIGTRKALGARRRTILIQFLIEAVTICLIGGTVGLTVAFGLFVLIGSAFPNFPVQFSPSLVATALVISVLTGIISGFAPAWQASRLSPVEALRYE